jgi:hypothetical protein
VATNFLAAVGYTILSYTLRAYAVGAYIFWILPKTAWLYWSGQIPPPEDPSSFTETHQEGKF